MFDHLRLPFHYPLDFLIPSYPVVTGDGYNFFVVIGCHASNVFDTNSSQNYPTF